MKAANENTKDLAHDMTAEEEAEWRRLSDKREELLMELSAVDSQIEALTDVLIQRHYAKRQPDPEPLPVRERPRP